MVYYSNKLNNNILTNPKVVKGLVIDKVVQGEGLLLTYINAHCFNIYTEDNVYQNIIDHKFTTYADGTGLWLLLRYLRRIYKRFNATDLNEELIEALKAINSRILIIGGDYTSTFVSEKAVILGINLAGYISGYLAKEEILKRCEDFYFDTIFIGMGVPAQELLAVELNNLYSDKIIVCVGNFFNFYFGYQKRSPILLQKLGLEWLFRIIIEPKRLWRRYILGIPKFALISIKIKYLWSK